MKHPSILNTITSRGLTAALLLASLVLAAPAQAREPQLEPLAITTAGGKTVEYRVEVARTQAQMQRGLMFRDEMDADRGMLFIYEPVRPAAMWMKNTILIIKSRKNKPSEKPTS